MLVPWMSMTKRSTRTISHFLVVALCCSIVAVTPPAKANAEVTDSEIKAAILAGRQVKSNFGCHWKDGVTGFLEVATSPGTWVRVNDILGWFAPPDCASQPLSKYRPWTIASLPKGAILRWTVYTPSWGRSYSSDPLETYDGPDPIPASGYFELKSGCYARGYSAILQYRKADGSWAFVSDAFGWSVAPDCPSATPVRPWAVTLMTLPPGTQYRWNIYFPGRFVDVYTEPEMIPYPTTTTTSTTTTTPPQVIRSGQRVIVCVSKTQRIRVVGRNPKCPAGYKLK